jgi:hypothetical protein
MLHPEASNEATAKCCNAETNETISNSTPMQRVAHHKNPLTAATISTAQIIPYSSCNSPLHVSAVQISHHQVDVGYTEWNIKDREAFLYSVRNYNNIMQKRE